MVCNITNNEQNHSNAVIFIHRVEQYQADTMFINLKIIF